MKDCIKCELIGGVFPRHLDTFSDLFIVVVHYTFTNTCYVLLLLLPAPRASFRGLDSIAQDNIS